MGTKEVNHGAGVAIDGVAGLSFDRDRLGRVAVVAYAGVQHGPVDGPGFHKPSPPLDWRSAVFLRQQGQVLWRGRRRMWAVPSPTIHAWLNNELTREQWEDVLMAWTCCPWYVFGALVIASVLLGRTPPRTEDGRFTRDRQHSGAEAGPGAGLLQRTQS